MAISYECGACNGTGKQGWSPYDDSSCTKCEGTGRVRAGGSVAKSGVATIVDSEGKPVRPVSFAGGAYGKRGGGDES